MMKVWMIIISLKKVHWPLDSMFDYIVVFNEDFKDLDSMTNNNYLMGLLRESLGKS